MSFSWIGLLLFALPMVPNILFFTVLRPEGKTIDRDAGMMFNILEHGGRMAFLVLLVAFSQKPTWMPVPIAGMVLFLGLYFGLWVYYFIKKRLNSIFFGKVCAVPFVAWMVVFPLLYYWVLAIWLKNWPSMIALFLFSVGHIVNSIVLYRVNEKNSEISK